ncbi:hypothetical protein J3R83DRAFT_4102 [Lanmaoa asiatica]|nr:hypothetical protein J3R83DRAFT_4102 [Lanmaoa asiatica]
MRTLLLSKILYIGWTMATRLGAVRLVLSPLDARTLCRPHHIPFRTFVVSTPTHVAKPFVPPASLETRDMEEEDGEDYDPLNDPSTSHNALVRDHLRQPFARHGLITTRPLGAFKMPSIPRGLP